MRASAAFASHPHRTINYCAGTSVEFIDVPSVNGHGKLTSRAATWTTLEAEGKAERTTEESSICFRCVPLRLVTSVADQ